MVDIWVGPLSYLNPLAYFLPAQDEERDLEKGEGGGFVIDVKPPEKKEKVFKKVSYPALTAPLESRFRFPSPGTRAPAPDPVPASSMPFRRPSLPTVGLPEIRSIADPDDSQTRTIRELNDRVARGTLVQWGSSWNPFRSRQTRSDFSQAMQNFSSGHDVTIVSDKRKAEKEGAFEKAKQFISDHNEAHHHYLKALKGPADALQKEMKGLPIEDQVRYYERAVTELTQVPWVRDREWKKAQVSRDFRCEALANLVSSFAARILKHPSELFEVRRVAALHLMAFAATEDPHNPYVKPQRHHVTRDRAPVLISREELRAIRQTERETPPSFQDHNASYTETLNMIQEMIYQRVIPQLDAKYRPRSIEELEGKIKANQAALAGHLNDVLDGLTPTKRWNQRVESLVNELHTLNWAHARYYPREERRRAALSVHSPTALFREQMAAFTLKYYGLQGEIVRTPEIGPSSDTARANYIRKAKEFLPIQRAMRGLYEAVKGQVGLLAGGQTALDFDPIQGQNVFDLSMSDLR